MHTWRVPLGDRSYDIEIGCGCLDRVGEAAKRVCGDGRVLLVTDRNVDRLYGAHCSASLAESGLEATRVVVPPGERTKSYWWLRALHDAMVEAGLSRKSVVVALGGGVVGDLAGFAAATYMRGIALIQVPTSLLAMVDSSVGGKAAINHPSAKNLIGAFLQPGHVLCDVGVLRSLPRRDMRSGLAEVVKHGAIADETYIDLVEACLDSVLDYDVDYLVRVIDGSCRIKAAVVAEDEREAGLRMILNYGHTFGHAFEKVGGYRRIRHGEAVALGMVCAGRLSVMAGGLPEWGAARIEQILERTGLPTRFSGASESDLWEAMSLDKKASGGKLKLVVLKRLGKAVVIDDPGQDLVQRALGSVLC